MLGRLFSYAARARALTRRAIETARDEGAIAVVRRTRQWYARRRSAREAQTIAQPEHPAPAPPVWTPDLDERYARWRLRHDPDDAELMRQREGGGSLAYRPLVSIVVPVFDPDPQILARCIDSVSRQTYDRFELCVANAGTSAECAQVIADAAARDTRIRVTTLTENHGISGNTNAALGLAKGEFVAFLDHDDELAPHALFAIVSDLNVDPEVDLLYSDQDRLAPDGARVLPFLKPDWSPEFLHSFMYVGHLSVYRRSLVERLGGLRGDFDGSQDYDLVLRASEVTDRIRHVPQVLYHWRMSPGSAAAGGKPDARRTNVAALADAMARRGHSAHVVAYPWANRVVFDVDERPLVSIVIPTDDAGNIDAMLETLLAATDYSSLEVVVVTNSRLAASLDRRWMGRVRCVRFDQPYNFSAKCNVGADAAGGDYLCFLNDDVEPLSGDWLDSLLQYAQLPEVGGVSPKLVFEDDTIHYAGQVGGVPDFVGSACPHWPRDSSFYTGFALAVRDVGYLTGACMLIRREVFEDAGRWDAENTPIAHSDYDFSLQIRALGLRLVYTPFAELRHAGSRARGAAAEAAVKPYDRVDRGVDLYMLHRWGSQYAYDPYYPPGMRELIYAESRDWTVVAPPPSDVEPGWWTRARVALISPDLSQTDAARSVHELARALLDAGAWPAVVSPAEGPLAETIAADGVPVIVDGAILAEPHRSARLLESFDVVIGSTLLSREAVVVASESGKRTAILIEDGVGLEVADALVLPLNDPDLGELAPLLELDAGNEPGAAHGSYAV